MKPTKQAIRGGLIGAALAATAVVTVYEGRVLLADEHGNRQPAVAGEKALLGGDAPPAVSASPDTPPPAAAIAAADLAPPAADAPREVLLARDDAQRKEIASLRGKVVAMEQAVASMKGGRHGPDRTPDGRPAFDPSKQTLLDWAKQCEVHFDAPPGIEGLEPVQFSPEDGTRMGVTPEELTAINEVLMTIHDRWVSQMRDIYIDGTGDAQGAEVLSPQAMAQEIQDKGGDHRERSRLQKQIAYERAGLVPPPADWSKAPPLERYFRMLAAVGDETEHLLADKIGSKRARELRGQNDGWGMNMAMSGCDDENEADIKAPKPK